ncbi:MAG: nucleoside deaminase [Methanosarcinales archaeon]|nr:nucleoside deaminase [Methanosarcinales archaeon]
MRMAIQVARAGVLEGQTPFGACVVHEGKVLSCLHNSVLKDTDITAHAEVLAIREACRARGSIDLSGCVIFSSCEPCPMCFSACHWARIDKIFYGARIEDAEGFGFHELPISNRLMKELGGSQVALVGDLLREESLAVFREWYARPDKKTY